MLKNARGFYAMNLHYGGCSCHNTRNARRQAMHRAKRREARQWRVENQ